MARKRRDMGSFNLSFLDCMCCGFGAVVLFFMIITANAAERKDMLRRDLLARAETLQNSIDFEDSRRLDLEDARNRTQESEETADQQGEQLVRAVAELSTSLEDLRNDTLSREEHINALKTDLQSLETDSKRLEAASASEEETGRNIRQFVGDGDRQYLTGLKMGGERPVILIDASASMLDETIVNIIRRRNMATAQKMKSRKWNQVVESVDWITTQLSASSQFQVYVFAGEAWPVVSGSDGRWLDASDPKNLDESVASLGKVIPEGGTNLHAAFEAIARLRPRPDNIFLLTDGLPTLDSPPSERSRFSRKTVDESDRIALFGSALKKLPKGIPVNTLLFPLEGDPHAALAYWQLAQSSGGSFIAPSADWP